MASAILLSIAIMAQLSSISAQPAPGCKSHCGDMEIPYPFGIGTECAIEPGFVIYCNKTADGSMKPFLINVEVLNISLLHGQTRALNALSTYCYNDVTKSMESSQWSLDFSTWPYRFSNLHNKFVVIGCNTLSYIYNGEYTTACASVCAKDPTNGSCDGVGCCQNNIAKGLNSYNVTFFTVYNDSSNLQPNPCSYAALVETDTFMFKTEYVTTMKFNETYNGQQPVVLDWAIGNVGCNVANKTSSYACRSKHSECVDSINGPGYLCNCTLGYHGNPYITDGCKDVNECEQNQSPCPKGATCHNTEGWYHCSCPVGRKLAKETNTCNPDISLIIGKEIKVRSLIYPS